MKLYTNDNLLNYEMEKLCRLFLPFEKIEINNDIASVRQDETYAIVEYTQKDGFLCFAELKLDGKIERESKILENADFKVIEINLALMLFGCFKKITDYVSPWGILTGVRPAKLMVKLLASEKKQSAIDYFKNTLLVSENKTKLCLECYESEEKIIRRSKENSFSLYISVPFCPSRCNYCSFVSHSVEQAKKLIPKYVELLCEEIKATAKIAKKLGLELLTVYIGGGTPTTLSAEQIDMVMGTINHHFDLSNVSEYTVEAGRPDTVTEEKLVAIKKNGATRISINPQTMNDEVLQKIGRRHTVQQMREAFFLARKVGFDNINTDLIAGLSGDTYEGFVNSVDEIIKLSPENITVHSLSIKRASGLNKNSTVFDRNCGIEAERMVDYAYKKLNESKIFPYYMYRQSKTVGNLENVGYSKKGFEGQYNVYIMDETHTILACGASAVTKLRQPKGNYIERIFNYKYPYEYIERFDKILERKNGVEQFYGNYCK